MTENMEKGKNGTQESLTKKVLRATLAVILPVFGWLGAHTITKVERIPEKIENMRDRINTEFTARQSTQNAETVRLRDAVNKLMADMQSTRQTQAVVESIRQKTEERNAAWIESQTAVIIRMQSQIEYINKRGVQ